jgi:hypothetical protein
MQYKLSICNNETLVKGLKQKIKDFEEGKVKKTKGKENLPNNKVKHVKVDLKPQQDLGPLLVELKKEKENM